MERTAPVTRARSSDLREDRIQRLLGYNLAQAVVSTYLPHDALVSQPFELRRVEFTILVLIADNDEVTPKQLSDALAVAAPNLTVILDRLERRSLLVRSRGERDRRQVALRLTEAGRELMLQAEARALAAQQDLLTHFSPGERAMLFELLQRLASLRAA